jgi:Arc/MetJ-type ribon-helix-helix transcriptional regulator
MVRIPPDQLALLDAWIEKQREHRSRPEAIRRILERALAKSKPA